MRVYTSTFESADDDAMSTGADADEPEALRVGIAEYRTASGDTHLRSSGFGSCVGVAVYDADAGVSGLAHVMLPDGGDGSDRPGKYADTAVPALVEEVRAMGGERLRAKLAGGSDMFEFSTTDGSIGERNVAAVTDLLSELGVPVVATDVGGDHGRSLELCGSDGDLHVSSAAEGDLTV